jgi:hypothetical protein
MDGLGRADDVHPLPHPRRREDLDMGLILLWLLGVPGGIILLLFLLGVGH